MTGSELVQALVARYNNQIFGITGADYSQCTAVPHAAEQILGLPITYGNAKDLYDNADPSLYDKFLNTPTGVPPAGAVVVWNSTWGGGYGHTGVACDGCTVDTLVVFEQNDGDGGLSHVGTHDYSGVIGWFVAKALESPPTSDVDAPTADSEGVVNGAGLRGHAAPNSTSSVLWYFADNEHVTLLARVQGENVTSGPYAPSGWWYLAHGNDTNAKNAGYPQVWISDAFLRTTHTPANVPDYAPPSNQYSPKPATGQLLIDISSAGQPGDMDYAALTDYVDGVILRAGHVGQSFGGIQPNNTDPKLAERQAALRGKTTLGYYWYCFPALDAKAEAQAFVNSVGDLQDGESLWADIEEDDPNLEAWSQSFKEQVELLSGEVCHGYYNRDFHARYPGLDSIFGADGVWGADYNGNTTDSPFNNVVIHQYADDGSVPGISGKVDLNVVLKGKLADYGKQTPVPTPIPTPVPTPAPLPTPTPNPNPMPPVDPESPTLAELRKLFHWVVVEIEKIFGKKS